jgi:hypothetical protein
MLGNAVLLLSCACIYLYSYVCVCVDIFGDMSDSVAPSISGDYTKDIKKAIACQVL